MAGVELAFEPPESNSESGLAAPATHPETDYGWIEAEAAISTHSHNGLLRVKHFKKLSLKVAKDLLDRGCVWKYVRHGRAGPRLFGHDPVRLRRRTV